MGTMGLVTHTVLLISLATSVTPGWYRRNDTEWTLGRPCSLVEHTTSAECHQTEQQLYCRGGISNQWMKGIQHDIVFLSLQSWPGECLNIGRLQQHFPSLRDLQLINCTDLHTFKGHFDPKSKITKIVMRGLTSLWEVPPEVLAQMPDLRELDIRKNVLRHMKARLLKGPPLLERVYLSDNKWDCSDGGLDWLAMERDNGTVKRRIVDYYNLVCHQQLYRGKPLHKVMDIIRVLNAADFKTSVLKLSSVSGSLIQYNMYGHRGLLTPTVRHTCPEPCSCAMTHVVSDTQGALIPLITANCAARELRAPPETLPPSTTTVRLEGNKIDSIRMMIQNPHYKKLADLHLDNNSIATVKELEGSEWFNTFRVLSLRGNMLKQIPVYAFDKAFQSNNNIVHVFLGHNPWRCDCHFIPRFQALLLKYKRVIRDLSDIRCSQSRDKSISLVQISTMPLGHVCRSDVEMPISPINIVNLSLATLLFIVIGRFLYDWHSFKNTGKLPWISSILP